MRIRYRFVSLAVAIVLSVVLAGVAGAALNGVSSIDPAILLPSYDDIVAGDDQTIPPDEVVVSIANGFPLWYEDQLGRRLELCLQQQAVRADDLTPFFPCMTGEPFPGNPLAFPTNFGNEAFYWAAITAATYQSSDGTFGDLLAVLAHEISFPNLLVIDGEQAVTNRIRLRANLPVPGTYRVTHPFGTRLYTVPAAGGGREIDQTQDVGGDILDFLASLENGPVPGPLADPAVDEGVVNDDGASIGPYLGAAGVAPILDTEGHLYLAEPGTELAPVLNPIEPGPAGVDYFEIELTDPPVGFFLNALDDSQVVRLTGFQMTGKLFNDAPNLTPIAVGDAASTTPGQAVLIDVLANDSDPRAIDLDDPFNPLNPANTNVHGINPQALGLLDAQGNILRTQSLTTGNGATVRRVIEAATGRALFLYTSLPGAPGVGEDSFEYVVQDHGGLISAAANVAVIVEELIVDEASYRPQTGTWHVNGSSSDLSGNSITLFTGPRAALSGAAEVPAVATETGGLAALQVTTTGIEFHLQVAPLPTSEVTAVHIHAGAADENGPVIFTLYDSLFDPVFAGSVSGQLGTGSLETAPAAGISTFADAVQAIVEGRAYINLHTQDHPAGEVRGQLAMQTIGTAPVAADGSWTFRSRSAAGPGGQDLANVNAVSANGNRALGVPLRIR